MGKLEAGEEMKNISFGYFILKMTPDTIVLVLGMVILLRKLAVLSFGTAFHPPPLPLILTSEHAHQGGLVASERN